MKNKIIFLAFVSLFLVACGGGSDGTDSGSNGNPSNTVQQSQAILGPLSGATVTAYQLSDLNTAIATTITTVSNELNAAGKFMLNIPSHITDDEWTLIKISGGQDIDADDNGVVDDSPSNNNGSFYGLVTVADLKAGANFTPISDLIYSFANNHFNSLNNAKNNGTLATFLTDYADDLIKNIDDDSQINYKDILKFNPKDHQAHYKHGWQSLKQGSINSILRGGDISGRDEFYNAIKLSIDNPQNTMQSSQTNGNSIAVTTITNDNDTSEKAVIIRQQQSSATISTYLTGSNNASPTGTTHINTKDGRLSISFPLDNIDTLSQAAALTDPDNAIAVSTTLVGTGTYYTVNIPKAYFSSWANSSPTISIGGVELKVSDFDVIDDDPIIGYHFNDDDTITSDADDYINLSSINKSDTRCVNYDTNENECVAFELSNSVVFLLSPEQAEKIKNDTFTAIRFANEVLGPAETAISVGYFAAAAIVAIKAKIIITGFWPVLTTFLSELLASKSIGNINILDELDSLELGKNHYPAMFIHSPSIPLFGTKLYRGFKLYKKCGFLRYELVKSIGLDKIKIAKGRSYMVIPKNPVNISNISENTNSEFVLVEGRNLNSHPGSANCRYFKPIYNLTSSRYDDFTTGDLRSLDDLNNGDNAITPPTAITTTASNNTVNLSWDGINGISEYAVYYSTNQLAEGVLLSSIQRKTTNNTNITITGLTNGTTYYFAIASIDGNNESMLSHQVLAVPDAGGNNFDSSNPLTIGQTINASIDTASDEDYYQFTPSTNGVLTIQTQGNLDTIGTLYNSSNNELTTDDDSGRGRNFKITYNVSSGETYYIKVAGYSGRTGDYGLDIQTATATITPVTIININSRRSDTITTQLTAGSYLIENIGVSDGGIYDGWSAWDYTECRDINGCSSGAGWLNRYSVAYNPLYTEVSGAILDDEQYRVGYDKVFPNALSSLDNANTFRFTLPQSSEVSIYVVMTDLGDNRGGISLRISKY